MVCKPIYPPRQSTVIVPNFNEFNLAAANPVNRFDPVDLATTATLNNVLLENTNLDAYPTLKARFEQSQITNEEFADFVFTSGYALEDINELFLEDFPVAINIQTVAAMVGSTIEQLETAQISNATGLRSSTSATTITGVTQNTLNINTGSPIIQNPDVSEVTSTLTGIGQVSDTPWSPGTNTDIYLKSLDDYFSTNLADAISNGLCSGFTNPFSKIVSLISAGASLLEGFSGLAGKIQGILSGLQNFSLSGLIGSLTSALGDLQNKLLGMVDSLKDQLLQKLENLRQSALSFLNTARDSATKLFAYINRKIQQAKEFFNDFNMERLKSKIKAIMTVSQAQFEDLLPAVLNLLGLRSCGMAAGLVAIMNSPVDSVKEFIDKVKLRFETAASISAISRNDAIEAGARRVPIQDRQPDRITAGGNANETIRQAAPTGDIGTQTAIEPGSYVTVQISQEERNWINSITAEGSSAFTFASSVVNMGKNAREEYEATGRNSQWYDPSQNTDDAGWKKIVDWHPSLYIILRRVNTRLKSEGLMGGKFLFNSCYRSPYYNRHYLPNVQGTTGAAFNSPHMSALAIDVSTNNIPSSSIAKFIQYCSEEGIVRVAVYNSFVHVDIRQGRTASNWTNNTRGRSDIARAITLHKQDAFRNG